MSRLVGRAWFVLHSRAHQSGSLRHLACRTIFELARHCRTTEGVRQARRSILWQMGLAWRVAKGPNSSLSQRYCALLGDRQAVEARTFGLGAYRLGFLHGRKGPHPAPGRKIPYCPAPPGRFPARVRQVPQRGHAWLWRPGRPLPAASARWRVAPDTCPRLWRRRAGRLAPRFGRAALGMNLGLARPGAGNARSEDGGAVAAAVPPCRWSRRLVAPLAFAAGADHC